VLLHNLAFGVVVTAVAARWVGARPLPLALVFGAFVAHLVGDYFGSGAGWGIMPFRPFSDVEYLYTMVSRDILVPGIVGNVGAALVLVVIAARAGRTPLEFVHAGAERFLVTAIQLRVQRVSCGSCASRAAFRCVACDTAVCDAHATGGFGLRPRCHGCAG
jgi:hypothetical protein